VVRFQDYIGVDVIHNQTCCCMNNGEWLPPSCFQEYNLACPSGELRELLPRTRKKRPMSAAKNGSRCIYEQLLGDLHQ